MMLFMCSIHWPNNNNNRLVQSHNTFKQFAGKKLPEAQFHAPRGA